MSAAIEIAGTTRFVSGAQVAVVREHKVLLQFRPFPPGWELPGGHIDKGETPEESAIREVLEETGLEISIEKLVGVYYWKGLRSAGDVLYLGRIQGGVAHRSIESLRTKFVDTGHLPRTLFPWCRQRAFDALAASDGADPVFRVQEVSLVQVMGMATTWLRFPVDAWRTARSRR